MRKLLPLLPLALWPVAQAQTVSPTQTAPNCTLANVLDSTSYADLTMQGGSEADQDDAAYTWAQCRAAALSRSLSQSPQLRARIDTLRKQYREMRSIESELAGIRAGGGTLYGHAVSRSFAPLEDRLQSLANLARSSAGAARSARYGQIIQEARDAQARYLKILRAYKPGPQEDYVHYDAKEWNAQVNRYEALGKSIMQTLGNRPDAATALGYGILNDWTFQANDPQANQ